MSVNSRLLLELENCIKTANKEIINPEIPELNLERIKPVMKMVARARAHYLKLLFEITAECGEGIPEPKQIIRLANGRKTYEELVDASQALDTAIQRGYLDVSS